MRPPWSSRFPDERCEPWFVATNHNIERPLLRSTRHCDERRSLLEFRARDRVFAIDVLVKKRPPPMLDVSLRLFELYLEACGLVFIR